MEDQFLNLSGEEFDKPIYRVIPTRRLFELFETKENILVHPSKWDDPFENFILNSKIRFRDGFRLVTGSKENLYGQCWTKTRESDGMWRIYSPEKKGVRIETTPRKLLKALYDDSFPSGKFAAFIGKVKYYKKDELEKFLKETAPKLLTDKTGFGAPLSLLFKRYPFKHENEVRLIYNSFGGFKGDLYGFFMDPFNLVDSIVFDPRMDYKSFTLHKNHLRKIGFEKKIVKSTLYQLPEITIEV